VIWEAIGRRAGKDEKEASKEKEQRLEGDGGNKAGKRSRAIRKSEGESTVMAQKRRWAGREKLGKR